MTRKDFEAIAALLNGLRPDRGNAYSPRSIRAKGAGAYVQWGETCRAMAAYCAMRNPRFDCARFLKACGLEE